MINVVNDVLFIWQKSTFKVFFSISDWFKSYVLLPNLFAFTYAQSANLGKFSPHFFSTSTRMYHVHEKIVALDNHIRRFAIQRARAHYEEVHEHKRENLGTSLITRLLFSPSHAFSPTREPQANPDPGTRRSY